LLLNPGTLILAAADSKPHALFASSHAPFTPQLVCRDEIKSEVDVVVEQEQEQEEEEDDEEIGGGGRRREEDGDEKTSAGIVITKGYRTPHKYHETATAPKLDMRFFFCQAAAAAFWREKKIQTDGRDEGFYFRVCGVQLSSTRPRIQRRQECEKGTTVSEKSDKSHQKLVRQTHRERERERELPRA
jgi:hypothetical protein